MTKDTALRLALEALEDLGNHDHICPQWPTYAEPENYPKCNCGYDQAITAIKAALLSRSDGEAKDEPVATIDSLEQEIYENTRQFVSLDVMEWMLKRYYTTPPQRKPLTDEEIKRIWESLPFCNGAWETFARAIEAAHGIKGEA